MNEIMFLSKISENDRSRVGGKALSLAMLIHNGFPVPNGFVIATNSIIGLSQNKASQEIETAIIHAFEKLGSTRVAVRSSAISEDSVIASFAGQYKTILNVTKENLITRVRECAQSATALHVAEYENTIGLSASTDHIAVIVQNMVDSDISGVMFTSNPVTGNPNEVMIECIYGLGELLAQGKVTPANFIVDKQSGAILAKESSDQDIVMKYKTGKTQTHKLNKDVFPLEILNSAEIRKLVTFGRKIESLFGTSQDIEWAKASDEWWILQSRPVTTKKENNCLNLI